MRHDNRNKDHIRKNNGIDKLYAYHTFPNATFKALLFIILANCIDEKEENGKSKIEAGKMKNGKLLHAYKRDLCISLRNQGQ